MKPTTAVSASDRKTWEDGDPDAQLMFSTLTHCTDITKGDERMDKMRIFKQDVPLDERLRLEKNMKEGKVSATQVEIIHRDKNTKTEGTETTRQTIPHVPLRCESDVVKLCKEMEAKHPEAKMVLILAQVTTDDPESGCEPLPLSYIDVEYLLGMCELHATAVVSRFDDYELAKCTPEQREALVDKIVESVPGVWPENATYEVREDGVHLTWVYRQTFDASYLTVFHFELLGDANVPKAPEV